MLHHSGETFGVCVAGGEREREAQLSVMNGWQAPDSVPILPSSKLAWGSLYPQMIEHMLSGQTYGQ